MVIVSLIGVVVPPAVWVAIRLPVGLLSVTAESSPDKSTFIKAPSSSTYVKALVVELKEIVVVVSQFSTIYSTTECRKIS